MSANTPSDFETQVLTELRNINDRLDKMEARLDSVETRLDRVEARLDRLENRLNTIEADQKEANIRLDSYQRGLDGMVRMATTIIVTTGAVVVIGNIVPAILMFTKFAEVATR